MSARSPDFALLFLQGKCFMAISRAFWVQSHLCQFRAALSAIKLTLLRSWLLASLSNFISKNKFSLTLVQYCLSKWAGYKHLQLFATKFKKKFCCLFVKGWVNYFDWNFQNFATKKKTLPAACITVKIMSLPGTHQILRGFPLHWLCTINQVVWISPAKS